MESEGEAPASVTLEHIVPRHAGGSYVDANLVAACSACNKGRANSSSVRRFLRLRTRLVRNGRWPPCEAPTRRVRQLLSTFRRSVSCSIVTMSTDFLQSKAVSNEHAVLQPI